MSKIRVSTILVVSVLVISICFSRVVSTSTPPTPVYLSFQAEETQFTSSMAWDYLVNYAEYSPVLPGSINHSLFLNYAIDTLENNSWTVILQSWQHDQPNITLTNVIGIKKGNSQSNESPIVILGAHFDARLKADKDPDQNNHNKPVPGINDGGSGVAVLLELSRVLTINNEYDVWIILFDAEDQGDIQGWAGGIGGWCIGSTYFVNQLNSSIRERIEVAIIVDLVGGPNLRLTREGTSSPEYVQQIWHVGQSLGYNDTFLDILDDSVIDDHTPFLNNGIPAVDIIQIHDANGYLFFQWHHTRNDTLDNVSELSLNIVGTTLELYLESYINHQDAGIINPFWMYPFFIQIGPVLAVVGFVLSIIILAKHRKRFVSKLISLIA